MTSLRAGLNAQHAKSEAGTTFTRCSLLTLPPPSDSASPAHSFATKIASRSIGQITRSCIPSCSHLHQRTAVKTRSTLQVRYQPLWVLDSLVLRSSRQRVRDKRESSQIEKSVSDNSRLLLVQACQRIWQDSDGQVLCDHTTLFHRHERCQIIFNGRIMRIIVS